MSKDKRQLRAEAVERLWKLKMKRETYDWNDVIEAMLAERDPRYTVVSQLIELLTDDEQPDTFHDDFYDCESTVDAGEDTREKLEADIRKKQREWSQSPYSLDTNTDEVLGWLDRQATITEREFWESYANGNDWQRRFNYEEEQQKNIMLQSRIDALTVERDKLREKVRHQSRQLTDTQNALEKRNEEIKPRWKRDTKKLQSRIDALTAERDEWRARAAEEAANAEGHRRNANNIAEECDARARALDMQLENIHNLEHERDELRRQVSELRELNDSLHARIEEAKEALS